MPPGPVTADAQPMRFSKKTSSMRSAFHRRLQDFIVDYDSFERVPVESMVDLGRAACEVLKSPSLLVLEGETFFGAGTNKNDGYVHASQMLLIGRGFHSSRFYENQDHPFQVCADFGQSIWPLQYSRHMEGRILPGNRSVLIDFYSGKEPTRRKMLFQKSDGDIYLLRK